MQKESMKKKKQATSRVSGVSGSQAKEILDRIEEIRGLIRFALDRLGEDGEVAYDGGRQGAVAIEQLATWAGKLAAESTKFKPGA